MLQAKKTFISVLNFKTNIFFLRLPKKKRLLRNIFQLALLCSTHWKKASSSKRTLRPTLRITLLNPLVRAWKIKCLKPPVGGHECDHSVTELYFILEMRISRTYYRRYTQWTIFASVRIVGFLLLNEL